MGQIKR